MRYCGRINAVLWTACYKQHYPLSENPPCAMRHATGARRSPSPPHAEGDRPDARDVRRSRRGVRASETLPWSPTPRPPPRSRNDPPRELLKKNIQTNFKTSGGCGLFDVLCSLAVSSFPRQRFVSFRFVSFRFVS